MRNLEAGKPFRALINQGAATAELKAAETGKQIIVTSYVIATAAASGGTATFKSAATAISGVMPLAQYGWHAATDSNGMLVCAVGEALNLTSSAAVDGHISGVVI